MCVASSDDDRLRRGADCQEVSAATAVPSALTRAVQAPAACLLSNEVSAVPVRARRGGYGRCKGAIARDQPR